MLDEFQRSDRTTSDVDFCSTVRPPIDPVTRFPVNPESSPFLSCSPLPSSVASMELCATVKEGNSQAGNKWRLLFAGGFTYSAPFNMILAQIEGALARLDLDLELVLSSSL
jgi:hypothetical protein